MPQYELSTICDEVKALILESLDRDGQRCSLSSNLARDLDAESIDFLDVVFRIEKKYKIKIERGQVEKALRLRFPDVQMKPNTDVTPEIKTALKALMPEISASEIDSVAKIKDVPRLFTVATFVRFTVLSILGAYPDAVITGQAVDGFDGAQLGLTAR